ncbi:MAG: hypothetical protein A3H32_11235 [Betaproteobacteria bacterium RIFCSPLOWO2_02_FULL_63_19]|nr:MAG: hypothetical protein A3H32_11235 [Betaproteobacteria bacterium RIFCSPLOWO2_02_FULL_63_19]
MRTLIWIPIASPEGNAASSVGGEHAFGETDWPGIRKTVAELELPYTNVHLYQDALPCCEKEYEVVRRIAESGSDNHELLLKLVDEGARLVGTEDASLLLHEYRLLQDVLGGQRQDDDDRNANRKQELLVERDRFIAARINATLPTAEIGLLFLGGNHCVEPLLDADILVTRLVPSVRNRRPTAGQPVHRQPTNAGFVPAR